MKWILDNICSKAKDQVLYSQHSIFFVTNRPNKLECFITQLEMLTSDKHSNLLGQFLCYQENEALWIRTQ